MNDESVHTTNRVAIVTGAAHGIGEAIALRLAADGFDVGLTAEVSLDGIAEKVSRLGRRISLHEADFLKPEKAAEVVEAVANQLGRVDVLVNNAGITLTKPIEQCTLSDITNLFSVNVFAGLMAIQAAVKHMRAVNGGSIINVSSILSVLAFRHHSVYGATKGAINGMTRQLALELSPDRIRVNAILPGVIEVPRYFDDPNYTTESCGARLPWGRPGTPSDVASVVSFLAKDDSEYMTGQLVGVDGGLSSVLAFP
jgi:NAD(P)-dependent dehydrogenase (short-subunit alcohol dehydrogenase family)